MLNEQDLTWLVQQIIGTAELLGNEITPTAAAMLADDLSRYPKAVLAAALSRVRTEHVGRLTPKAVLDRIDEAMGRPAANEAWAVALEAMDERNTVVWTNEVAQAWQVASAVAASGDMVGARMTFISTYERLVRCAREERRLPVMMVSEGYDPQLRALAVNRAVELGHLPAPQAAEMLLALNAPAPFSSGSVQLIGGKPVIHLCPPEHLRETLAAQREQLANAAIERAQAAARKIEEREARVAEQKADLSAKVARYVRARGER